MSMEVPFHLALETLMKIRDKIPDIIYYYIYIIYNGIPVYTIPEYHVNICTSFSHFIKIHITRPHYLPFMSRSLLSQAKYWTQTCGTISACSFRRARWTTSSNRSYETTSTYAPSHVSIPYTAWLTPLYHTQQARASTTTKNDLLSVHILLF